MPKELVEIIAPKKGIKMKIQKTKTEEKFNNELGNQKIGILLKKHLIEQEIGKEIKYFQNENIQCLGGTKKEIMQKVITIIDQKDIKLDDLPNQTQKLIESIKRFIHTSN